MRCDECSSRACVTGGLGGERPEFCPYLKNPEVFEKAKKIYERNEKTKQITKHASAVELEGYMQWPRLKDTIEFAKRMDYEKIGLPYCIGLQDEANKVAEILDKYELNPISVVCKSGSVEKSELDVPDGDRLTSKTGYLIGSVSCDPVGQALYLNEENTDLNVIVGLCVGHDVTFTEYSNAPVTTLIAKDRPTSHNPASVLNSYYWKTFFDMDNALPELDDETVEKIRQRTEENLDEIIEMAMKRLRGE